METVYYQRGNKRLIVEYDDRGRVLVSKEVMETLLKKSGFKRCATKDYLILDEFVGMEIEDEIFDNNSVLPFRANNSIYD